MTDGCSEHHEVRWCDLPGYRLRHLYVGRLRRQQVRLVVIHDDASVPAQPVAPRIWTRAERAHRRLTWEARLTRNCCRAGSPRYRFTVWGVVPALAAYLGLAPQAPA